MHYTSLLFRKSKTTNDKILWHQTECKYDQGRIRPHCILIFNSFSEICGAPLKLLPSPPPPPRAIADSSTDLYSKLKRRGSLQCMLGSAISCRDLRFEKSTFQKSTFCERRKSDYSFWNSCFLVPKFRCCED